MERKKGYSRRRLNVDSAESEVLQACDTRSTKTSRTQNHRVFWYSCKSLLPLSRLSVPH